MRSPAMQQRRHRAVEMPSVGYSRAGHSTPRPVIIDLGRPLPAPPPIAVGSPDLPGHGWLPTPSQTTRQHVLLASGPYPPRDAAAKRRRAWPTPRRRMPADRAASMARPVANIITRQPVGV
jgi:hypothetical protein